MGGERAAIAPAFYGRRAPRALITEFSIFQSSVIRTNELRSYFRFIGILLDCDDDSTVKSIFSTHKHLPLRLPQWSFVNGLEAQRLALHLAVLRSLVRFPVPVIETCS